MTNVKTEKEMNGYWFGSPKNHHHPLHILIWKWGNKHVMLMQYAFEEMVQIEDMLADNILSWWLCWIGTSSKAWMMVT